jgi:hypothetical protein
MNRNWVLQNLREAVEHLQTVIHEIESGSDVAFDAWIEFIYRDLNRAWNGRSNNSHLDTSDEMLRQFPKDVTFED